jgi:hypothetical protein
LPYTQEELQSHCDAVEGYQRDLEENIRSLERDVQNELDKFNAAHLCQENDQDRDNTYTLAAQLNVYVESIEASLDKVIEDFNLTRGGPVDDSDNMDLSKMPPHEQIVRVLNNHHDILASLDEQHKEIARELAQLTLSIPR